MELNQARPCLAMTLVEFVWPGGTMESSESEFQNPLASSCLAEHARPQVRTYALPGREQPYEKICGEMKKCHFSQADPFICVEFIERAPAEQVKEIIIVS